MHAKTSIIVASLLALAGATSATPSPNAQGFVKVARNGMERRQATDPLPEVNDSASQVSGDAGCTQRRPSWVHGGKYGVRTHGRHHNLTGEHRHHSNKTSTAEDEPVFTLPVESSESSTAQVEPTETSSASSSASTTASSTTSSSVIEDAMPTPSPSLDLNLTKPHQPLPPRSSRTTLPPTVSPKRFSTLTTPLALPTARLP